MKKKVYFKIAMAYFIAIITILGVTLAIQKYTDFYDEKNNEIDSEINKQLEETPNPAGDAIAQEFRQQSDDIRSKEKIVMVGYFLVFLVVIVVFLVLMLKKAMVT